MWHHFSSLHKFSMVTKIVVSFGKRREFRNHLESRAVLNGVQFDGLNFASLSDFSSQKFRLSVERTEETSFIELCEVSELSTIADCQSAGLLIGNVRSSTKSVCFAFSVSPSKPYPARCKWQISLICPFLFLRLKSDRPLTTSKW